MTGGRTNDERLDGVAQSCVRPEPGPVSVPTARHGRGSCDDRLLAPLRRHWRWTCLGVLIAGLAAATRFVAVGVLPPSVRMKPFEHAEATTAVMLGSAWQAAPGIPLRYNVHYGQLTSRSYALADMVASPMVAADVARAAGVPASQIGILGPIWADQMRTEQWANGPKRAAQIVMEKDPYQLTINQEATMPDGEPVIGVYAQAPSGAAAARLARAVPVGLGWYLGRLRAQGGVPERDSYRVTQLGGVTVTPGSRSQLLNVAVFTFVAVFGVWCFGVVCAASLMRDLRATAVTSEVGGHPSRSSDARPLLAEASLTNRT